MYEQVVRIGELATKGWREVEDGTTLSLSASACIGREKVKERIFSLLLD